MIAPVPEDGGAHAAEAHVDEGQFNPIIPEVGELFWGAVSFAALYLLVRFVLLPPILRVMDQRRQQIDTDLDAATAARDQSGRLEQGLDDQLADVRAEAAAIIDQARSEAAAERARLVSQAEREVLEMKEQVRSEINGQRSDALKAARPEVVKLSVNAACRVLDRNIDASAAKPILEQHLGNMG